ncbi:MAG: phosphoribosylanthranilate isomerase [Chlorobi bacterium]|nr:phosphoribosylanthranilate isomerase [Chlorobiota bacterium]
MKKELKIKVCGMKFPDNMAAVSTLPVDMLGFIFYPPSKRYIGNILPKEGVRLFNTSKEKVGVFVNEKSEVIISFIKKFRLNSIQLHGDESPEYCRQLKSTGIKAVKAFRVNETFDFETTSAYLNTVDLFLFDTKAEQPGGTGEKFDWQVLENYHYSTPFLLSGGIQPEDTGEIKQISHPMLYGVDLNSGFEDEPGLKNIGKLEAFIKILKQ